MSNAAPVGTSWQKTELRALRDRSTYERRGKRVLDVVISGVGLIVTAPITLPIAAAVRLGLGKGVLYHQSRVGMHGEPFTILKFRTMRHDRRKEQAESISNDRRQTHKHQHDPRHTGLGRLLRKLSLDELPQLWNVLRGDMSIVGPRPELVHLATAGGYVRHIRHEVRPGITGAYQLSGMRADGDLSEGLELDQAYVEDLTFRTDLRLMLRTVAMIVTGRTVGS